MSDNSGQHYEQLIVVKPEIKAMCHIHVEAPTVSSLLSAHQFVFQFKMKQVIVATR